MIPTAGPAQPVLLTCFANRGLQDGPTHKRVFKNNALTRCVYGLAAIWRLLPQTIW